MEKKFKILGIQQIAIGALSKEPLNNLWVNLLGGTKHGSFKSETENVDEDIILIGEGKQAVEIDLMQPIDPNKKPKVHEPSLNHIGLWVDDINEAYKWLSQQGVRFAPGGIRKGASGFDVCFIHPKGNDEFPMSGEGTLIELVQTPK